MANIKDVLGWYYKNNEFLDSNDSYDKRMKILKLLFISHGFYEAKYNKKLFSERFEAWKDGPVDNEAYAKYINYNYTSDVGDDVFEVEELEIIRKVNYIYGIYSGKALSDITHQFMSWSEAYREDEFGKPINHIPMDKTLIKKDFKKALPNFEKFTDFTLNNIVQIVNGVTMLINKSKLDLYEENIDDIYDEISEITNVMKQNKDYLLFINFDENGKVLYEL